MLANLSRIQKAKHKVIKEAALEVFSSFGFRGSTLDQIAKQSDMSKSHLIYYFPNKEAIHAAILADVLKTWLQPLEKLNASDEPLAAMLTYVERKAMMAQEYPRESRLFANEIIQGAPRLIDKLEGELADLVAEKVKLITGWMEAGKITQFDPYHLIFSIWATTQHYADFQVQVDAVYKSGPENQRQSSTPESSIAFLLSFYRKALAVN